MIMKTQGNLRIRNNFRILLIFTVKKRILTCYNECLLLSAVIFSFSNYLWLKALYYILHNVSFVSSLILRLKCETQTHNVNLVMFMCHIRFNL